MSESLVCTVYILTRNYSLPPSLPRYVGFREWPDGILPGDLFPTLLPVRQRNPWTPLIELLTNQKLPHAPVLQLQWRVRLLHPVYPYAK